MNYRHLPGERDTACGAREHPKPERSGRSFVTFSNSPFPSCFLDLFRRSLFSKCGSHRKVEAVVEIGRGERADEERGRQQHLEGRILHSKMGEDRRRHQDRNHQTAEDRGPRTIDTDQKQNRAGDLQNREEIA